MVLAISMNSQASNRMRISLSIADLPLNISFNTLFPFAASLHFDGVEVVVGYKSGMSPKKIKTLSAHHSLPILSIHQSSWAIAQIARDESGFRMAHYFAVPYVAHLPFNRALDSQKSQEFFKWLSRMGEKYNIQVLLENMPRSFILPGLKYIKPHESTTDLAALKNVCDKYGFGITFDTSHAQIDNFKSACVLDAMFSLIKNIHLSDFTNQKQHLALGKGSMDCKSFLYYLARRRYNKLLTLELSPRIFYSGKKYLDEIRLSMNYIRSQYA